MSFKDLSSAMTRKAAAAADQKAGKPMQQQPKGGPADTATTGRPAVKPAT